MVPFPLTILYNKLKYVNKKLIIFCNSDTVGLKAGTRALQSTFFVMVDQKEDGQFKNLVKD